MVATATQDCVCREIVDGTEWDDVRMNTLGDQIPKTEEYPKNAPNFSIKKGLYMRYVFHHFIEETGRFEKYVNFSIEASNIRPFPSLDIQIVQVICH